MLDAVEVAQCEGRLAMSPMDVLVATRARLLAKGWSRGVGRCVYMTMETVVPDIEWYGAAPQAAACRALRSVTGSTSLVEWNDRQSSVDHVIDAIDRAIEALRP